jgi:chemotaxis protein methyltransferase CheR
MKTSLDALRFFAEFIRRELGIVYHEANFYQLETRLEEVARQCGLPSADELYREAKVRISPQVRPLLLDIATNNETSFFRDPPAFKAIEELVLKEFLTSQPRTPLRIWSAACSFGQEPYSLAMLLEPHLSLLPFGYQITATDIADRVLTAAERGLFTQLQVQRGLPANLLARHFIKSRPEDTAYDWQIRPELKQRISFKKLNLLDNFSSIGPFDLILCRNVLIYQSVERKREIVAKLLGRLSPRGFLILGAAESMLGVSDDFDLVRADKATLYRARPPLSRSA